MNQREAAEIVTYLNRAGLVGAMEGQVGVWADLLGDVDAGLAREVVRDIARTRTSAERWVTPGDVRAHVSKMKRERLASAGRLPDPPQAAIDAGTDLTYVQALHREISAGADVDRAHALASTEANIPVRPLLTA